MGRQCPGVCSGGQVVMVRRRPDLHAPVELGPPTPPVLQDALLARHVVVLQRHVLLVQPTKCAPCARSPGRCGGKGDVMATSSSGTIAGDVTRDAAATGKPLLVGLAVHHHRVLAQQHSRPCLDVEPGWNSANTCVHRLVAGVPGEATLRGGDVRRHQTARPIGGVQPVANSRRQRPEDAVVVERQLSSVREELEPIEHPRLALDQVVRIHVRHDPVGEVGSGGDPAHVIRELAAAFARIVESDAVDAGGVGSVGSEDVGSAPDRQAERLDSRRRDVADRSPDPDSARSPHRSRSSHRR